MERFLNRNRSNLIYLMHSGHATLSSFLGHLLQLEQHLGVEGEEEDEGDQTHQEKVHPDLRAKK